MPTAAAGELLGEAPEPEAPEEAGALEILELVDELVPDDVDTTAVEVETVIDTVELVEEPTEVVVVVVLVEVTLTEAEAEPLVEPLAVPLAVPLAEFRQLVSPPSRTEKGAV